MAMFERKLFKKPIAVTRQDLVSGYTFPAGGYVEPPTAGPTRFFSIPWDRLGFLKRVEATGVSGYDVHLRIYDDYYDEITKASGWEKRKAITIPDGTAQINWDEDQDIPLLGTVYVATDVSGIDVTIGARTM